MKEQAFIERYEAQWQALEDFLQARAGADSAMPDFPQNYRRLCDQLAFANTAGYSPSLIHRLNTLAVSAHRRLYQSQQNTAANIADFFLFRLPAAVRQQWRYIAFATAVFLLPLVLALILGWLYPEWAAEYGEPYRDMYAPSSASRLGESRGAANDVAMFGHYVLNNTSIGLRTIASGAILGVGVIVSLAYNGWLLGMVSADMLHVGYAFPSFFPFVITHSAFEITAIIFSGACGFAIARALFFPGRQTRGDAIRDTLHTYFPILLAIVLFFFIAALIEAFWSAISTPPAVKFISGAILWTLIFAYFVLFGRGR